jgi:hypothetical protein
MHGANLDGADIRRIDLREADLIIITLPIWTVYVYDNTMRVGRHYHTHEKWMEFSDEQIRGMDSYALAWWQTYKPLIVGAMESIKTVK